jgi:hypothetical protein
MKTVGVERCNGLLPCQNYSFSPDSLDDHCEKKKRAKNKTVSVYEDEERDIIFISGGGTLIDRNVYLHRLIVLEQALFFDERYLLSTTEIAENSPLSKFWR